MLVEISGLPPPAALHAGGLILAAEAALHGDHDQTRGTEGKSSTWILTRWIVISHILHKNIP